MNTKSRTITFLAAAVLIIFGAMYIAQAQAADKPEVKITQNKEIGRYLADAEGMTLYYFTKDSTDKSTCFGFCLDRWLVFYTRVATVPAGMDINDFNVITRADGRKQSTYKGRPLYYFTGDSRPGDIRGQGVGENWYVVAP